MKKKGGGHYMHGTWRRLLFTQQQNFVLCCIRTSTLVKGIEHYTSTPCPKFSDVYARIKLGYGPWSDIHMSWYELCMKRGLCIHWIIMMTERTHCDTRTVIFTAVINYPPPQQIINHPSHKMNCSYYPSHDQKSVQY